MNRFGAVSNKVSTVTKTMMRRGRHEEEAIAHKSKRGKHNANDSRTARLFRYRGDLCTILVSNEVFEHLGASVRQ